MELIALYLFFALLIGLAAAGMNRSGALWFMLAVVTSPLIGGLLLLLAGKARPADPEATGRALGKAARALRGH